MFFYRNGDKMVNYLNEAVAPQATKTVVQRLENNRENHCKL
ncbi:MAG: hypothetical protein JWR02_977 [Mucilaginibacter sp.]|nr:hypothetical protein [Mucilaginibacter sp.]